MSYIQLLPEDTAAGPLAERFAALRDANGFVPNAERALAGAPDVAAAFQHLVAAIAARMDSRRYELIACTAARARQSRYCALVHGRALATIVGSEAVHDMFTKRSPAALGPDEAAIAAFTAKAAVDPTAVTKGDIDRLRTAGLDDDDIRDCVLAVALRAFVTTALDALGIEPDAALKDAIDERLLTALTAEP